MILVVDLCMTTIYQGEEQLAVYIRNTIAPFVLS